MIQKNKATAAWSGRRTRHDPPDVDEAIAAAKGLTDCVESQIEIAAQLIGLPEDEVRPAVLRTMEQVNAHRASPPPVYQNARRVVVIEKRNSRIRPR